MKIISKPSALYFALTSLLASFLAPDAAQAAGPAGITIGQGWTNQTAKPHSLARGFFTIHNAGAAPDVLTSVTCPVARETMIQNGQNHDVAGIAVGAGQSIQLTPAGMHLVLNHTHFRFYSEADIPCNVVFRNAGTLMVYLHVEPATASSYHPAGASRSAPT
jgi:copper(I)-binding protein